MGSRENLLLPLCLIIRGKLHLLLVSKNPCITEFIPRQLQATVEQCFFAEGPAVLLSMSLHSWGHMMFSSLLCKLQTCRRISKPHMIMCSKESTVNQGNFQCLSAMPRLRATCSDDLKKHKFTVYFKKYKYPNFVSMKLKENSLLAQHLIVSLNYLY